MHIRSKVKGFTLIEVLVVLAIVATLLSLVTPRYFETVDRARETSLKHSLITMRDAIDKYYSDNGTYPDTLDKLVDRKYLRAIPVDPITERPDTWLFIPPPDPLMEGDIYDVYSGSEAIAEDGSYYADW
ncbi:MAG: prepilin-type N-terminal cleavage/methylation domain-containing protein [Nitrosomonadales bacterium]|nr:prepilin-type N-terminal cleavage/methylation domain-containing protein [Nitrosomonadales bacterium]